MKGLTKQEIEALKEAEDILFSHLDDELEDVFSDSAVVLHIAIKNYTKLMLKDAKPEHKKAIDNYVKKSGIIRNKKGVELICQNE